ncbi:MAG: histidine phosphatase family protein [Coriobacteriia bacterium]|nr:histidine phosphatase family protein [Coriobacteriia bacterium]
MPETLLLVVRHPETEANVSRRFVGQGETPYTHRGQLQARRLPGKIAAFAPETIRTSPLLRARVVAQRAARLTGAPMLLDDRLLELDFGAAHGLTWDEAIAAGVPLDYRSYDAPVAPGGESRLDLQRRVAAVVGEVRAVGGRHALVCHAGVMRAAFAHLFALSSEQLWSFEIATAQLALIRVGSDYATLVEYRQG